MSINKENDISKFEEVYSYLSIRNATKLKNELDKISEATNLYENYPNINNKYYYEYIPLLNLATHMNARGIKLIQDQNQHYDGEIYKSSEDVQKVEFVSAGNHYNDKINHETAKKYGWANPDEEHPNPGSKHNRKLKPPEEPDMKPIGVLIERVEKQIKKNYYQEIILAITYDDLLSHKKKHLDLLIKSVECKLRKHSHNFSKIYIIGTRINSVNKVG